MSDDRRAPHPVDGPFTGDEKLSRLYQQTKEETPPSHLDTAVLEAARRAAQPFSRRLAFLPSRKWTVPLSLAAALLVSLGVVQGLRKEIAAPVLIAPSSSSVQSPAPLSERMLQHEELDREGETLPTPEREAPLSTESKETTETLGEPSPAVPQPPTPVEKQQSGSMQEERA